MAVMPKKIFYGWWISIACFFIGLYVAGAVVFGFTAFFQPLIEEFGWSYTQISLAASLRGLENGIFAPLIGFLADRVGSRRLIFFGTILVGLGLILMSLTRSLAMFYGSFFLISLGAGGCMSVVLMSVVGKWFHENVGKALGLVACGFGAGGLIVPLIVWLIDAYHWRTALILLGMGMWGVGIPLSFVVRDRPEQHGTFPDGKMPHGPTLRPDRPEGKVEIPFREAVRGNAFRYLILVEAMRMMAIYSVITHCMPHLGSAGLPRTAAGIVAAAIPVVSILGRFGFGWLGDLFDKRYMLAGTLCLAGLGIGVFCFVEKRWTIPIFVLLFSSGFGGGIVVGRALVREYFGRDSFGKMIGILMGAGAVGGMIGPTLAGWIFDTAGNYRLIWLFYVAVLAIAVGLTLKIRRPAIESDAMEASLVATP